MMIRPPDLITLTTRRGTAVGVRELAGPCLRRLAEEPAELLAENFTRPVKIGDTGLIVIADLPTTGLPVRVALKQYRPRNWWKGIWGLVRSSRALQAWRHAWTLLDCGVATARPVAACQPRGWRWRGVSYLATEWIEEAENLHRYGWRLGQQPLDRRLAEARRCAESLGRLLGRMHAAGIAHRDLKATNLLVVASPGGVTTYVIDLDGVHVFGGSAGAETSHRKVSTSVLLRFAVNLARLAAGLEAHPWVTRTVCLRFLLAYVEQFPPDTIAWKWFWRRIAEEAGRIIRRKRRHGRPLL
jgi:hypothetical protein